MPLPEEAIQMPDRKAELEALCSKRWDEMLEACVAIGMKTGMKDSQWYGYMRPIIEKLIEVHVELDRAKRN